MTRSDFYEEIDSISELIVFCDNNGISDFVEDLVDEDGRDDRIDEYVEDAIRHQRWYDIRDVLDDITDGYEYYLFHGPDNIEGFTNSDFIELRDQVLEHCLEYDIIVDDYDEAEEDDYDEYDDEDEDEDEEDEPEDDCDDPDTDDEFAGFIFGSIGKQCAVAVKTAEDSFDLPF